MMCASRKVCASMIFRPAGYLKLIDAHVLDGQLISPHSSESPLADVLEEESRRDPDLAQVPSIRREHVPRRVGRMPLGPCDSPVVESW
jgi:hypothetical protein